MKHYNIKSPSGKVLVVEADSIYSACEKARAREFYNYSNGEYIKLNKRNHGKTRKNNR